MRKVYSNYRNRRAFTLIELMVVVAIIGILATMVVINLQGAQKKSRDTKRKSDASMIMSAIVMYGADNGGELPASSNKWIGNSTAATHPLYDLIVGNGSTTGGYMDKFPCDPKGCPTAPTAAVGFTGYSYYRSDSYGTVGVSSSRKGYVYVSLESAPSLTEVGYVDSVTLNTLDKWVTTTDAMHVPNIYCSAAVTAPRPITDKYNFKLGN